MGLNLYDSIFQLEAIFRNAINKLIFSISAEKISYDAKSANPGLTGDQNLNKPDLVEGAMVVI